MRLDAQLLQELQARRHSLGARVALLDPLPQQPQFSIPNRITDPAENITREFTLIVGPMSQFEVTLVDGRFEAACPELSVVSSGGDLTVVEATARRIAARANEESRVRLQDDSPKSDQEVLPMADRTL